MTEWDLSVEVGIVGGGGFYCGVNPYCCLRHLWRVFLTQKLLYTQTQKMFS